MVTHSDQGDETIITRWIKAETKWVERSETLPPGVVLTAVAALAASVSSVFAVDSRILVLRLGLLGIAVALWWVTIDFIVKHRFTNKAIECPVPNESVQFYFDRYHLSFSTFEQVFASIPWEAITAVSTGDFGLLLTRSGAIEYSIPAAAFDTEDELFQVALWATRVRELGPYERPLALTRGH